MDVHHAWRCVTHELREFGSFFFGELLLPSHFREGGTLKRFEHADAKVMPFAVGEGDVCDDPQSPLPFLDCRVAGLAFAATALGDFECPLSSGSGYDVRSAFEPADGFFPLFVT